MPSGPPHFRPDPAIGTRLAVTLYPDSNAPAKIVTCSRCGFEASSLTLRGGKCEACRGDLEIQPKPKRREIQTVQCRTCGARMEKYSRKGQLRLYCSIDCRPRGRKRAARKVEMVACACGCGRMFNRYDSQNRTRLYADLRHARRAALADKRGLTTGRRP